MKVDLEQSLEQIENEYWGEATYDSHLVITCHKLRKKPLKDFTVEDLRIMIGQNISLALLVPIAIEHLKQDILAKGDLYPGDLLQQAFSADENYWRKNPSLHRELIKLFRNNQPSLEKRVGKSLNKGTYERLFQLYEEFAKIHVS